MATEDITAGLIERLLHQGESESLDFKSEQYPWVGAEDHQKLELLKDILAFANAWRERDAYIIIGAKPVPGQRAEVINIDYHIDDAQLQEFVSKKTNRPVGLHYHSLAIDGKSIGVIRIPKQPRPTFLTKDFGAKPGSPKDDRRLLAGAVYFRQGSSTFIASSADSYRMGVDDAANDRPLPTFKVRFVDPSDRRELGEATSLSHEVLGFDLRKLPNYSEAPAGGYAFASMYDFRVNRSFWREAAERLRALRAFKPLRFSAENTSATTASDVRVEIALPNPDIMGFIHSDEIPKKPSTDALNTNLSFRTIHDKPDIFIERRGDDWFAVMRFGKLQPKQRAYTDDLLFAVARLATVHVDMQGLVYADEITPVPFTLSIDSTMTGREVAWPEIKEMIEDEHFRKGKEDHESDDDEEEAG
jgi:Putative DNA-binding domain